MRQALIACAVLAASAVHAQDEQKGTLGVWLHDNIHLVIDIGASGRQVQIARSGSVYVGDGNVVHRVIADRNGAPVFAYDIEAFRNGQDLFTLRIKPLDPSYEQRILEDMPKTATPGSNSRLPTFSAARDVPGIHAGDTVSIDMLQNPNTGEKLFDLIRLTIEMPPQVRGPAHSLTFTYMQVLVNGRPIMPESERGGSIGGDAARIYIPGKGAFVMSLILPPNDPRFQPAGNVERNRLTFMSGEDRIEVVSAENLLGQSERGQLWVLHLPGFKPRNKDEVDHVQVMTADSAESLIPRPVGSSGKR
jgi:hypothetical protein